MRPAHIQHSRPPAFLPRRMRSQGRVPCKRLTTSVLRMARSATRAAMPNAPSGVQKLSGAYKAPAPDYAFGAAKTPAGENVEYVLAAFLGVAVITVAFALLGKWQKARLKRAEDS